MLLKALSDWWRFRKLTNSFHGCPIVNIGCDAGKLLKDIDPPTSKIDQDQQTFFENHAWTYRKHKVEIRVWGGIVHQVCYNLSNYGDNESDRVMIAGQLLLAYTCDEPWQLQPNDNASTRWDNGEDGFYAEVDGHFVEFTIGTPEFEQACSSTHP